MLSISVIIFFSVVLFVYWFRYSCLLILQDRAAILNTNYASNAGLNFPAVQQKLRGSDRSVAMLDQLHSELTKDYRILCFLLRCTPDTSVDPIERRMLMLDYWIMQGWYNVSRRLAPPQARMALEEMSNIVSYFAHSVGRNSASA
jgi:hypothetical protein